MLMGGGGVREPRGEEVGGQRAWKPVLFSPTLLFLDCDAGKKLQD